MRRRLRIQVMPAVLLLASWHAQSQAFRDPMRPAGVAPAAARAAAPTALKLEGVIAGLERVAIVNGRLVRAGDSVAGATILEVLADAVRYSRAGRIQLLVLPLEPVIGTIRVARSPEAQKP
jgi:sRNA-binding protein